MLTPQEIKENNRYCEMAMDYVKELSAMNGDELPNPIDLNTKYISYIFDPNIVVKKLYKDSKFVGFIIFESLIWQTEYPPFEWYVMETYVKPEYRKQGLVSKALKDFTVDHSVKSYGYVVLNENDYADNFWKNRFKELGFKVERKDDYFKQFDGCKGYIAKCSQKSSNLYP